MDIYSSQVIQITSNITQKLVLNRIWGKFTLSKIAIEKLCELKGENYIYDENTIQRDDVDLIYVIEELGELIASGNIIGINTKLEIIEFTYDSENEYFIISNCDGYEAVIIINKNDNSFR